jgi:thiol-disulfide isomerase/thioredoxin
MKPSRTFAVALGSIFASLVLAAGEKASAAPAVEGQFPSLAGATEWINSAPLTPESLRGKVVLVNVWTYSCINSLRPMPYLRAWAEKYKDAGLVVIGVHSPEFEFEKRSSNVHWASGAYRIGFPVAVDSNFGVWRAFSNEYWPAFYFIDAQGRIRHHRFGEGQYDKAEQVIQQLLAESGRTSIPTGLVAPQGEGVEAVPGPTPARSQETYLGYSRASGFASPGGAVRNRAQDYRNASLARADRWALTGEWTVERERVVLARSGGRIAYRFNARDLHLVIGPSNDAKPVRFRVLIDGRPPLADHGTDTDAEGRGTITNHRLYQLVRQVKSGNDRVFEIEFLDPGVQAYVFTFG